MPACKAKLPVVLSITTVISTDRVFDRLRGSYPAKPPKLDEIRVSSQTFVGTTMAIRETSVGSRWHSKCF